MSKPNKFTNLKEAIKGRQSDGEPPQSEGEPPLAAPPLPAEGTEAGQQADASETQPKQRAPRPPKPPRERAVKGPQEKLTVKISEDIVERLKNAAFWTHTPLAELAEEGLRIAVSKVEAANGGPFKRRAKELRPGRPLGPAKR